MLTNNTELVHVCKTCAIVL